jgi:2-iminoacetate synthase ThiH
VSAPATEDARPADAAPAALAALDLFVLGRQACAARDARWDRRGFFVRARHLDIDGIVLFPFKHGESDAERLERLAELSRVAPTPWGIMPAPIGEPFGLDTLRCFALCRLALPGVPHLLADVSALGPRLAQMVFGFGADELYAPIVAERALRLGANANNPALTRKEAVTLIRGAGLVPCERMADGSLQEVTS